MPYVARKAVLYILALWGAVTMNFVLPRLMPGNPLLVLQAKFQGQISPRALHAFAVAFGLNPNLTFFQQYLLYLGQLVHGNLGASFTYYPESVVQVLAQALPWTVFLVGFATVISFLVGTLLGILAAWRRGTVLDRVVPVVSTFTSAFPYFWLALLAIFVLAFKLGWFPLSRAYSGTDASWAIQNWPNLLYHAALPAFTIVVSSMGGWILSMRNNMVATMSQDFIMVARAKGLTDRRIMVQYAARNAILPSLTGFALALGFVVSGSLLTEVVFSYPGLGYVLFQAVQSADYPLMQGALVLIAMAVLGANLLVDLLYVRVDPRVREQ